MDLFRLLFTFVRVQGVLMDQSRSRRLLELAQRETPGTSTRASKKDCIVLWDDATENVVFINEIESVDPEKAITVGSRIKMLYKRKWYFGKVIEIDGEDGEIGGLQDERKPNDVVRISTAEAAETSSKGTSTEDTSPPDDTDEDPDYDCEEEAKNETSCDVVGCKEEVFSSCDKCLALMCHEHFLICSDLECSRGHVPKIKERKQHLIKGDRSSRQKTAEDFTEKVDLITIEDVDEDKRTVGTQTQLPGTAPKSTQTSTIRTTEDEGNVMHPTFLKDKFGGDQYVSLEVGEKGKQKKYFCIYCKSLVMNFARHIQTNHLQEPEVAKLCGLPKRSTERMNLLNQIRGYGSLYYNTSPDLNKGNIIVKRRKSDGLIGYSPCPKCKNFYKKASLHKHFKTCTGLSKTPKNLQTTSLSCTLATKSNVMDEWLKNEIVPGISNKDNVRMTIVEDPLLIKYGNYLCIRHRTNKHLTNMVRGKLRHMAKLLIAIKYMDKEITDLQSIYKPAKYDLFMKAIDLVSGFDRSKAKYRAPSLVTHLGHSAQECANILQTQAIKEENEELQARVVNWLKLYKQEFYYGAAKSALQKVAEKKWSKPRLVPMVNDIMKLNKFIQQNIEEATQILEKGFNKQAFDNLNKAVMLQIIIFNRKRIGEVEKLLITDFEKRHSIQKDSEVYNTLSARDKIVASRYKRMEVRGKLGRPVSLLISRKQEELIKCILEQREKAKVGKENPYVFGRYDLLNKTFYSASSALRWFAQNCGAFRPDLLTGTKLRKHMATISQAMDLTENDLSILADFMGHNITTHRNFYRMPSEVTHLAKISQVLLSIEEGDVSRYAGKRLDEINVDIDIDLSDDEEEVHQMLPSREITPPPANPTLDETEKKNSQKRTGALMKHATKGLVTPTKKQKIQKKPWKTPERHVARKVFSEKIKTGRLPSLADCIVVLRQYKELSGRTPDQLKAWTILVCSLCSRTTSDGQGEVDEVLDDFPFNDDGGGSDRDDEGGGKEADGDINELDDIDLSTVEQAEGSRQELLRKVMTAAMAKPGARQRLAQVMPILRTMSATQRLALAGLVTSQLMAPPGAPLPNINTTKNNHTDDLMIPISMDIAAMFRGLGRDATAARSNLFRPNLYKRHPPYRRKPVQNLNRRNTEVPLEGMRPPPPPRVKLPKLPGMHRFPPPLPPGPVQPRPPQEAGEDCEYFTNNICLQVSEYPMEAILKSIQSTPNKNAFEALRMDAKQQYGETNPQDAPAMERRQSVNGLSVDPEEDGHMCSSKVEIARPKRARATSGLWKYVVNTAEYTQTLRLEMCLRPQQACSYLADNFKSECTQVYNYHRLLTWDHKSGLTMDIFKVPTCCSCHVHSKYSYPGEQVTGSEPQSMVPSQPLEPVRHATSPPRINYVEGPENNFVAGDEPPVVHRLPPPKQILNRRPQGGIHITPKRESLPANRVKGHPLGIADRPDDQARYPYPPYENLLRRTISRNSSEFNEISRPKYHPVLPSLNQRHPELPIDSLLADNSFSFVTSEPDYLPDTRYKPQPAVHSTTPKLPVPQRTYPSTPKRAPPVMYQSTPPPPQSQPSETTRRVPQPATTPQPPSSKRVNYSYHPIIDFFKTSVSATHGEDKLNNAEWTPITDGPRLMLK